MKFCVPKAESPISGRHRFSRTVNASLLVTLFVLSDTDKTLKKIIKKKKVGNVNPLCSTATIDWLALIV